MKKSITITVNGTAHHDEVEPRLLLVHYLREVLGLTGTHVGCETSICGACTVILDGQSVKSCTMFAVQADGASITTIEGMAASGDLHPVQEGFWEQHGLQCGYCTPGMIMAAAQIAIRIRPSNRSATGWKAICADVPVISISSKRFNSPLAR